MDVFPVLFLFKGSYRVKLAFLNHLLSLLSQLKTVTTSERLETVSSCGVMSESELS